MNIFTNLLTSVALISCLAAPLMAQGNDTPAAGESAGARVVSPVDFSNVKIDDSFWSPILRRHKEVTIPVCIDQMENQTGRLRNFDKAAKGSGKHEGIFFNDSDVYKALEGMSYSLTNNPDPDLESKCDNWIGRIAAAQREDGYINTYFTIAEPDKRWTDMDKHEMYCAGHLIEAGIAYFKATGKRSLLDVGQRMADYMMSVFGPGKRHWVPGHEEIELALVKLYQVTGDTEYLDFSHWLLEQRGHSYGVFNGKPVPRNKDCQDFEPVSQMRSIYGHAVRAMYLYCGMSDVAGFVPESGYQTALDSLWTDVVKRNMYITGGIGQSARNEGITEGYDLPNLEAYCETCASVGMILWNWRMNQMSGDAGYVDVLERSMYNGALAGISLSGDRFFYVNPLESKGEHHRQAWFGCACCPSQICRFLPSIGNYIYGTSSEGVWVNLYIGNEASFNVGEKTVRLRQETDYPWDGSVNISVGLSKKMKSAIRLRIPGWCDGFSITVNGKKAGFALEKGYAVIQRVWKDGDSIILNLEMPVKVVSADPRVKADIGKRAVQRGPVVYCMEEIDNPETFGAAALSPEWTLKTAFEKDLLCGVETITAANGKDSLKFIPYYAWDNRAPGKMRVWVDYK